ncbi:Nonribosomal peptide synthetase 12 [Apiospora arundinis]
MSVQKEIKFLQEESTLLLEEVHSHYPTEYDLEVHVDLFTESIDVSWEYTKAFMSDEQVQNIADAFQMTLLGIISKPHQSIKDVDTFGDLNKERIKRVEKYCVEVGLGDPGY